MSKKWTVPAIKAAAKLCKTRYEFSKRFSRAYNLSIQLGIREEVCRHLKPVKNRLKGYPIINKWSDDYLISLAKSFPTAAQMNKGGHVGEVRAIIRRGLQEQAFAHMNFSRRKYSDAEIISRGSKFATRFAFEKGDKKGYELAKNHGLLDRCFTHSASSGYAVSDEFITVYRLLLTHYNGRRIARPYVYIGLTTDLNKRLSQHKENGALCQFDLRRWSLKVSKEGPFEAETAMQIERDKITWYRARSNQYQVLNKADGGGLGSFIHTRKLRLKLNQQILEQTGV